MTTNLQNTVRWMKRQNPAATPELILAQMKERYPGARFTLSWVKRALDPPGALHKTRFAGMEKRFEEGCRNVWAAIQDDIAAAGKDESHVPLSRAAEAVVDLGCFDQYCRLFPGELEAWHAVSKELPDGYRLMMKIARDALKGQT